MRSLPGLLSDRKSASNNLVHHVTSHYQIKLRLSFFLQCRIINEYFGYLPLSFIETN